MSDEQLLSSQRLPYINLLLSFVGIKTYLKMITFIRL